MAQPTNPPNQAANRGGTYPATSVGMLGRIENLVLPGSELEPKPLDDRRAKLVIRIVNVDKHGTAHRYDLTYYALEPGIYDLRDYLRRKDGSEIGEVPPIVVSVQSVLPPGQILPNALEQQSPPFLGGYSWLVIAAGVFWVVGLVAILLVGRKKAPTAELVEARTVSLADRLRPLVERGLSGELTLAERAALERSLLGLWTRRLHLEAERPAERFARLRADPDAGPLLVQLESWLHRPGLHADMDLGELLRPYRNLPADALDEPEAAAR